VSDLASWKVEVVDANAASLPSADLSLAGPDLSQPARSWNEIPRLGIRQDALLERNKIIMRQLASSARAASDPR
jgi:hypothetical protein